jgi:hypothetical protein
VLPTLVGLADTIPNEQAVALSPTLGWLLLGCAVVVASIFTLTAERWRRWWLTAEDPRGIAVFRIVFTFFVIANINDMWEFFEFLYTDEGIFPADVARQVFASQQFAGFGDGMTPEEPWGFFDAAALWEFLKGPKWSLLYFWDTPTFFWAHLIAFYIAAVSLMLGFRTRMMGVLTWFLMNSILVRNHLAWEGTELVYRCFLAYLVLARSGHAYSIDNWLRCRKLRRRGELSERDGPGGGAGTAPSEAHPSGLAPVYRLIPSWPRKLIMLQLATIYLTTGALKTGSVWMNGDSLYYALNLDHFYRVPPQFLSSLAGTTVFRAMTYAVKVGQMGFPLIMVGIITRWMIREKLPPLTGWRAWALRGCFFALVSLSAAIAFVAWPVHFTPKIPAWTFAVGWIALWTGIWAVWRKLTYRPWHIEKFFRWKFDTPAVIDRTWVCRWILGRRVLLVWHLAFHAHIFTLMNVGQFQTGMLSATFVFIEGREIATLLRDIGHRLARWKIPFIPESARLRLPILPAADPSLPQHHRDAAFLPQWTVVVAILGVVAGIVTQVVVEPKWDFRYLWICTAAFVLGVALVAKRRAADRVIDLSGGTPSRPRMPWAYGPIGRLLVGGLLAWHIAGVATWLMPDKDCLSTFRPQARQVFAFWLTRTTTDQGWGMFAPNPPRSNVFLKVLVTDADGKVWDLRSDVYAEEQKPIPWIWNTRLRKMNRRIIGGESGPSDWYRKWYARYECRRWARDHGGTAPTKVELVKVWYQIPSPQQVRERGYYLPEELLERQGHESVSHTETCARTVMGQLPNYIRERDGLPLLPPGAYKPWIKHKRAKWDKRQETRREAEAAD